MQEKQTKPLGSEHLSRMKMIVKGVTGENKKICLQSRYISASSNNRGLTRGPCSASSPPQEFSLASPSRSSQHTCPGMSPSSCGPERTWSPAGSCPVSQRRGPHERARGDPAGSRCAVSAVPAPAGRYPKRNLSRYRTGPALLRGGDGAALGWGGGGFLSGRATVKASSGGCGCQKRGRKCVETCWGRARGLQPRLALPRLLSATYHGRPERGLRCTAEAYVL